MPRDVRHRQLEAPQRRQVIGECLTHRGVGQHLAALVALAGPDRRPPLPLADLHVAQPEGGHLLMRTLVWTMSCMMA